MTTNQTLSRRLDEIAVGLNNMAAFLDAAEGHEVGTNADLVALFELIDEREGEQGFSFPSIDDFDTLTTTTYLPSSEWGGVAAKSYPVDEAGWRDVIVLI